MRDAETWVKLNKNLLEWRWYKDVNTKAVFIHLLLTANYKDLDFENETIHRGELATSMGRLAESVGITYDQARTALKHLESTQEVTIKRRPKYLVISITNYDRYQGSPNQIPIKSQSNPNQIPTSKEYKNKRNKEYNPPISPLEEDEEFQRQRRILWGDWRPKDDKRGS